MNKVWFGRDEDGCLCSYNGCPQKKISIWSNVDVFNIDDCDIIDKPIKDSDKNFIKPGQLWLRTETDKGTWYDHINNNTDFITIFAPDTEHGTYYRWQLIDTLDKPEEETSTCSFINDDHIRKIANEELDKRLCELKKEEVKLTKGGQITINIDDTMWEYAINLVRQLSPREAAQFIARQLLTKLEFGYEEALKEAVGK